MHVSITIHSLEAIKRNYPTKKIKENFEAAYKSRVRFIQSKNQSFCCLLRVPADRADVSRSYANKHSTPIPSSERNYITTAQILYSIYLFIGFIQTKLFVWMTHQISTLILGRNKYVTAVRLILLSETAVDERRQMLPQINTLQRPE